MFTRLKLFPEPSSRCNSLSAYSPVVRFNLIYDHYSGCRIFSEYIFQELSNAMNEVRLLFGCHTIVCYFNIYIGHLVHLLLDFCKTPKREIKTVFGNQTGAVFAAGYQP